MIPKIIHYCWFGYGKMPLLAKRCIQSWKKYLPDYEIKEWNEHNFDLSLFPYAQEAYDAKKYAFVTDVVRLYALYTEGGIYMDTDVEVLKSLDPFLLHTAFSGFENETQVPTGIMASERGGIWARDNLEYYQNKHFINKNGEMELTTNVVFITEYMLQKGLIPNDTFQDFPGLITIYPHDYFCPKSYKDQKIYKTNHTVTIHHFNGSWKTPKQRFYQNYPQIVLILSKIKKILRMR